MNNALQNHYFGKQLFSTNPDIRYSMIRCQSFKSKFITYLIFNQDIDYKNNLFEHLNLPGYPENKL